MKSTHRALFALHVFVGLGGIAGGLAAITDPTNPLGVPVTILQHSPFDNFLVPGILLFAIIGIGNIISAAMTLLKWKYQGYSSSVVSWGLVIWIVVQCIMLRDIVFLHILFFIIGLVQAVLSMSVIYKHKQFPMDILIKMFGNDRAKSSI